MDKPYNLRNQTTMKATDRVEGLEISSPKNKMMFWTGKENCVTVGLLLCTKHQNTPRAKEKEYKDTQDKNAHTSSQFLRVHPHPKTN